MSSLLNTDTLDYFPIRHGLTPSQMGLRRLPSYQESEKNKIFHFGNDWNDCLENKRLCRSERLSKYYRRVDDETHNSSEICLWMIDTLCNERGDLFSKQNMVDEKSFLWIASHTGDSIGVKNGELDLGNSQIISFQNPQDLFDAISMQVAEDLVIQDCSPDYQINRCASIHLCHANGWSAEWAIGKDFDEIHARVPRMSTIVRDSTKMLKVIVESPSPLERVGAVNFRTSPELNRHPEIPDETRHVPFHHTSNDKLYLRFERQCVVGFKTSLQFLFTIRTHRIQIHPGMPSAQWESFVKCMQSSSDGTNPHRFLQTNRDELNLWILAAQKSLS